MKKQTNVIPNVSSNAVTSSMRKYDEKKMKQPILRRILMNK